MPEDVTVWVDGSPVRVSSRSMVSAAIMNAAVPCRESLIGEPRTALCGMGICFECRAIVDGVEHTRTCQLICQDGMKVKTQR